MTRPSGSLRDIPSVTVLLESPEGRELVERFGHEQVVAAIREQVSALRSRLLTGEVGECDGPWGALLLRQAAAWLAGASAPSLRPVVNATGVVLHTNLGRAVLAPQAIQAMLAVASGYSNLELDLEGGERGDRSSHVDTLLCELTGAEAACVVNNNAGSMLLLLDELARGGEVVVARSELIEIGGSFRLPDVLARSGARLIEVGTTNRCYLDDYEAALSEHTSLLLKSHPSNYRIIGFTHEVSLEELASLGQRRGVVSAMDLGCGVLVDLARWGLPAEPTARQCVESGVDVACFSGDKLLGGPQAGILVGKAPIIARLRTNPLMRALRCDKTTLAALEATLRLYRSPEKLARAVPTLEMLARPLDQLEKAALALAASLKGIGPLEVRAGPSHGLPGGGTLPGLELPTWVVRVEPAHGGASAWARGLRQASEPVVARVERGCVLFDVRTLLPGDAERIVRALREVAAAQALAGEVAG